MKVALAFLRRDRLIWQSYRLAVLWQALGVLCFIGLIYFVGSTLGSAAGQPGPAGKEYVAFVLGGLAFTDLIMQGLYAMPQALRDYQKSGTLEPILLAPTSALTITLASALFRIVLALGRVVTYLVFGFVVLGLWPELNVVTITLVALAALLSFMALGVLSSAFIIVYKQGDPILVAYGALTALISGIFFPLDVLPGWIQSLSLLLPLSHALAGIRAGLDGAAPTAVGGSIGILLGIAALTLPLSVVVFGWAVDHARREGSLGQY